MKKNHFLSISLMLIGLIFFINAGCDEDEPTAGNNPPVVEDNQPEPAPAIDEEPPVTNIAVEIIEEDKPAQAVDKEPPVTNVDAKVKPAPDQNVITEGYAFPDLEFTSYSGQKVNIADLKGKVVLVDFWAAWCPPCTRAMPDLIETYKQFHDKGLEIIGISLDREKSQFEDYIKKNDITWQQYYDGLWWDNKIGRRFGIGSIPHMVLIDQNGAVHYNTNYDQDKPPLQGKALRDAIAKMLS